MKDPERASTAMAKSETASGSGNTSEKLQSPEAKPGVAGRFETDSTRR